jgi:hypothetical protein
MEATQQRPHATGSGDPRLQPGSAQGQMWQTPAAAPPEPIGPDEWGQQLTDQRALAVNFPLWFVWFRGRRWSATRYSGERIEADSAAEIAARLGGTIAKPESGAAPPAAGPSRVPRLVRYLGDHGHAQVGQPRQAQARPPQPTPPPPVPVPHASDAA